MNFDKFLMLELKRHIINVPLFLSLVLSLALGGGIIYSINELGGPFQPGNVSGLYAAIATVALGIYSAKIVISDLHYGTIHLLFTSAENRIKFLLSRIIVIVAVSLLFGIGCSALLYVNHILNHQVFSLLDIGTAILHYELFGIFFTLLFLIIAMYYQKPINLLGLAMIIILVLPGIFGLVFQVDAIPELIKDMVAYFPVYSLTNQVPFLAMNTLEMVITIIVTGILFVFAYLRLPKIDY